METAAGIAYRLQVALLGKRDEGAQLAEVRKVLIESTPVARRYVRRMMRGVLGILDELCWRDDAGVDPPPPTTPTDRRRVHPTRPRAPEDAAIEPSGDAIRAGLRVALDKLAAAKETCCLEAGCGGALDEVERVVREVEHDLAAVWLVPRT